MRLFTGVMDAELAAFVGHRLPCRLTICVFLDWRM